MNFCSDLSVISRIAYAYFSAKEAVIKAGYGWEIEWQNRLAFEDISESDFLRESAWVILSGGMREKVIQKHFSSIADSFFSWNIEDIVRNGENCVGSALKVFNHPGKLGAILDTALLLKREGYEVIKKKIEREGMLFLRTIPFIGPITVFHLAKNIGIHTAKPDRHLARIAESVGYPDAVLMCQELGGVLNENPATVDIVMWRFATIFPNYLDLFKAPQYLASVLEYPLEDHPLVTR